MRRTNPDAPHVAGLYLELGPLLSVRGDMAFAQALHETDRFRFHEAVTPERNNFGCLGATGPGDAGNSFPSPELGVLAHLQHLYAYASTEPLPVNMAKVDPYFDQVQRGSALYVGDLGGRWGSSIGYGQAIDRILAEILLEPAPDQPYQITRTYLDPSSPNRPGPGNWQGLKGIIVHRTHIATLDAWTVWQRWNETADSRMGASHFVVDSDRILQAIPIGETARHTPGRNLTHVAVAICGQQWGTARWMESYRKLVWLCAYLIDVFRLTISDLTGHFWWDSIHSAHDPIYLGWTHQNGESAGLLDWNQFIADVQERLSARRPAPTTGGPEEPPPPRTEDPTPPPEVPPTAAPPPAAAPPPEVPPPAAPPPPTPQPGPYRQRKLPYWARAGRMQRKG